MDPLQTVTEPRRREILSILGDAELAAGDIAAQVGVSFSAVSQHLARLLEIGVVEVRRDGRSRLYRTNRQRLAEITGALQSMWTDDIERLARIAELAERHSDQPPEQR
ncbi:MAG: metalloregulator ArsR/SmtB family transcription factor [Chloroflexi bacterium]|nr:metalloregulator ArsR/SmtB family transcription factor [Chloroflexota bacterium]MDA1146869.1 metalloregulator ArsR/SmtB family transcription factor [Chloroflexota bacterium]